MDSTQIIPYPKLLTSDQIETLNLLLNQAERAIIEINDPLKNDELETIPDETLEALKAAGGYGLQVPEEYGGAGIDQSEQSIDQ